MPTQPYPIPRLCLLLDQGSPLLPILLLHSEAPSERLTGEMGEHIQGLAFPGAMWHTA